MSLKTSGSWTLHTSIVYISTRGARVADFAMLAKGIIPSALSLGEYLYDYPEKEDIPPGGGASPPWKMFGVFSADSDTMAPIRI